MADISRLKLNKNVEEKGNRFLEKLESNMSFKKDYTGDMIAFDWVDEIEQACPYIDIIVRVPKNTLIQEENVMLIEKSKRINVASIKNLAKHTEYINKYDKRTASVEPSKILDIRNEETYNIYENRFLYTLIDNLERFITKKEKLLKDFELSNERLLEYTANTATKYEKVNIEMKLLAETIPSKELDNKIKTKFSTADLTNKEYELTLLQRELINNVGQYALRKFVSESDLNKQTYTWLTGNLENLRLYIMGGKPDGGSYYNSLNVLSQLYDKYKSDFEIKTKTKYGTVLGDLYKRMAITLSLTHSSRVALWMQPSAPENQSNAVTRYQIYKDLHKNDKFVVSSRQDHTKWFEELKVEEMRYVLNNIIDDEEILWLNEYTQKYIDAHPNKEEEYLQPHHYMKYIWPNYGKAEYHDEANKEMWSKKYGNFLDYGVTFRPGLYKLWMNLDNGAVCGGISKIGSNIRAVHGTPSAVIGQPGHAAIIYYRKDAQGRGYWSIDNDVSGWAQSERGERKPLGWGNDSYVKGYNATYIMLAQEALNHFDEYEKNNI